VIVSRTPLRITLGGGGTDLPSFYNKHGGFVLSLAIDKYIYVTYNPNFFECDLKLRYSQIEVVKHASELKNHRAKEILLYHGIENCCEINTCADLPSNSGLGSSGSFLVGLSHVVRAYKGLCRLPRALADDACHIEIDRLQEPVGKQDQYIAAFGGFRVLDIAKDGTVAVSGGVSKKRIDELLSHIHLYYTNVKRDASEVLSDQRALKGNAEELLVKIKEQSYETLNILQSGNILEYGEILDEYWRLKRGLSSKISIREVDEIYDLVKKKFDVLGGKIVGAGGGGFLLLFVDGNEQKLESFMGSRGYNRLPFDADYTGSIIQ
jgi:D-glycero-alpha-D-manno-heptose-7-phosphate kinase